MQNIEPTLPSLGDSSPGAQPDLTSACECELMPLLDPVNFPASIEAMQQLLQRTLKVQVELEAQNRALRQDLERDKKLLREEIQRSSLIASEAEIVRVSAATRLSSILSAVNIGVWEFDPIAQVLEFDDMMYELYGLNRENCPNPLDANERAIHPEDKPMVQVETQNRIDSGDSKFDIEFRVVHPSGSVRHILAKIVVFRDRDGVAQKIRGADHDVSALRDSENQLRQTYKAINSAAIVTETDLVGTISFANDKFCEISGYSRHELIGKTHRIVNSGYHDRAFFRGMWARLSSGKPWSGEIRNQKKDGSFYWVQTVITPMLNSNNEVYKYLALRVDITEAKNQQFALAKAAAEAAAAAEGKALAESANRIKTEFLANMSHEIRTPLAIIRGYAELFAEDAISVQKRNWLDCILRSSQQLELLISDILDISKVEAGRIDVELVPTTLAVLLSDISDLLHLKVSAKGIRLTFSVDGSVPATIHTDPLRLKQILLNVIGNAIKFTDHGSVEVVIKLIPCQHDQAQHSLAFVVSDTGIGITPEQKEKIFGVFVQADSSISRRFGGTGLGLALSLNLARLLGGSIDVGNCQSGQGSTFTVTINPGLQRCDGPRLSTDALVLQSSPVAHENLPRESIKGMNILLVEDAEDIRVLVSHILTVQGASVTTALNGEEGVQLARKSRFDLVLMDLQMPILDGKRATQQLRAEGYRLPIFALTAHAMSGERESCLAAGFTDYMSKPINVSKLIKMASRYRNPSAFSS